MRKYYKEANKNKNKNKKESIKGSIKKRRREIAREMRGGEEKLFLTRWRLKGF